MKIFIEKMQIGNNIIGVRALTGSTLESPLGQISLHHPPNGITQSMPNYRRNRIPGRTYLLASTGTDLDFNTLKKFQTKVLERDSKTVIYDVFLYRLISNWKRLGIAKQLKIK